MICTAVLSEEWLSCGFEASEIDCRDIQSPPSHCCHFCTGQTGMQTCTSSLKVISVSHHLVKPGGALSSWPEWWVCLCHWCPGRIPGTQDTEIHTTSVLPAHGGLLTANDTDPTQPYPMKIMELGQKDIGSSMNSSLQSWWSSPRRRPLHESSQQQWERVVLKQDAGALHKNNSLLSDNFKPADGRSDESSSSCPQWLLWFL